MLELPAIKNKIARFGQLYGASLPLALARYCTQEQNIKLIITESNQTANQLALELEFFLNKNENSPEVAIFPDWETLPYDNFSPHQDIISDRLRILNQIQTASNLVVFAAASTVMHRLCPKNFINQNSLILKCGSFLNINNFRATLEHSGYYSVNTVLEHGEYAVRGAIIDVFPMGSNLPIRIELFADEIDTLRTFDTDSQKTIEKLSEICILPAREMPLNNESITLFRNKFRSQFNINPSICSLYETISSGKYASGIEYYMALFFEDTLSLFDYLPDNTHICLIEDINNAAEQFNTEIHSRYEQLQANITRPILPPKLCFLSPTELFTKANQFKQIRLQQKPLTSGQNFAVNLAKDLPINRKSHSPFEQLAEYIKSNSARHLIIAESAGRQEMLIELLKQSKIYPQKVNTWQDFLKNNSQICIIIGPINYGAEITTEFICLIVESQFFGTQAAASRKVSKSKIIDPDTMVRDLVELQIGAPVVHLEYGVGRYQGLQTFADSNTEFLTIAYAREDKIYVPVTSLHLISRYTGSDSEHAPLHSLRSEQWQKEKNKAMEKIHDVAIELLEIYAKREAKKGYKYKFNKTEYQTFASRFLFSETQDQANAIQEIIQDMTSDRPMDRLICGDVGFGKTEVAMRAAFLAAQNGKQVCILAPTTLLADQHYNNFKERFVDFPITIELLSRFRSQKESTQISKDLEQGKVDIIIGTHKLIQNDIKFKNLGLLIIDEEHRFGVKQKEHIKKFREEVDILCMTATPIPRTLNLSMAGIRDISLIASPPAKRLSIKTFWQTRENSTIKEAILREILRGGQVFFLHNSVDTIENVLREITSLIPEAKAKIAHGQMPESELEKIMSEFYHHKFNVLVCTTIIETGIDIPTANTIIIDRADKFGLAQLHQLRGRVGRSHHQAYAYLLTPNEKILTDDSKKRLEAIVTYDDLGAGFTLATLDMEIRGAGELLGKNQSGHMHAIGFNLYMELLDKAVSDLKNGKTPELSYSNNLGTEIDLRMPAIIPNNYISDIHQRLIMYKRIANAKTKDDLDKLQIELINRFGLLPNEVKLLFTVTALKIQATQLGIKKIIASQNNGYIEFSNTPNIDTAELIKLIQLYSKIYKLEGQNKLKFTLTSINNDEKILEISKVLDKLTIKI